MTGERGTGGELISAYGAERYSMILAVLKKANIEVDTETTQAFIATFADKAAQIKKAALDAGYHYGARPFEVGGNTKFYETMTAIGKKMLDELSPSQENSSPALVELRRRRAENLIMGLVKTLVVDVGSEDYKNWKEHLLPDPKKPRTTFGTTLA